jgi:hypothetical protein
MTRHNLKRVRSSCLLLNVLVKISSPYCGGECHKEIAAVGGNISTNPIGRLVYHGGVYCWGIGASTPPKGSLNHNCPCQRIFCYKSCLANNSGRSKIFKQDPRQIALQSNNWIYKRTMLLFSDVDRLCDTRIGVSSGSRSSLEERVLPPIRPGFLCNWCCWSWSREWNLSAVAVRFTRILWRKVWVLHEDISERSLNENSVWLVSCGGLDRLNWWYRNQRYNWSILMAL